MKIILSPAKKFSFAIQPKGISKTEPVFSSIAAKIHQQLEKMSFLELKDLLKLSDSLTELNLQRFKDWHTAGSHEIPCAVWLFAGDVYQTLAVKTLESAQHPNLQNSVRILSGLYGILRPFDNIMPYRLEMGTKLATPAGEDLYSCWRERITSYLLSEEDDVFINLASAEYSKAINWGELKKQARAVEVVFQQVKQGNAKTVGVLAKKARGMFARYALEEDSNNIDELKRFHSDGYAFNSSLSSQDKWFFQRVS